MLTSKQENFCINIVAGMSGKDSYIAAYDTKCGDNTAYTEACKLLKRDDIQDKIKALRKPLELQVQTKALSEYDKIKELLWKRIEHCVAIGDDNAIVKYTDQINRMNHTYVNINKDITEDKTNIETLDNDTLLKLVN